MLYDNKALNAIPVKLVDWKGAWQKEAIFKLNKETGLVVEAVICGRSKFIINEGSGAGLIKHRYVVLHVDILRASKRRYDSKGEEIEPDFGSKKKVNTGYLSSSYKSVSKEGEDVLQPGKAVSLLSVDSLNTMVAEKMASLQGRNLSSIWCDETTLEGAEISDGNQVRLRTKGEGPYLESIICLDIETTNLSSYSTGTSVGGSWTDKVMGVKDETGGGSHLTDDSAAVEDDEWDD